MRKYSLNILKRVIISVIGLSLILSIVYAQTIEIKLIQYDPESTYARIQVRNIGGNSLKNLTLSIDDNKPIFLVGILSPGNAIVHSKNIQHGTHSLRVNANDGIVETQEILFAQTLEQRKKEIEIEKNISKEILTENKSLSLQEEVQEQEVVQKKSGIGKFFVVLLFLIILVGIIFGGYWYIKRPNIFLRRKVLPRPIPITPVNIQQRNPMQLKKMYELRAKRREEMMRNILRK